MEKLVAIITTSEMTRVSHISNRKSNRNISTFKMASIVVLIGGALANALAFTDSSYLFSRLSKDSINKEEKRHVLAKEQLQKAQVEWVQKQQERIDFINKQLRLERKVETKFTELHDSMREYHDVFGHQLLRLPRKPVLSGFYASNSEKHAKELAFITLSMIGIGGVLWYLED